MIKPYFIERGMYLLAFFYGFRSRSLLNFEGIVRAEILPLSFLYLQQRVFLGSIMQ